MSDHPNIDEVHDLAVKLVKLTEDPHPGLSTWCMALGALIQEIKQFGLSDLDFEAPAMHAALKLLTIGIARIEHSISVPKLVNFCIGGLQYPCNGDWDQLISTIGWDVVNAAIDKAGK